MEDLHLADLTKTNDKYLRRDIDGGILTDKYEIDRYKQEQYISVVDNLMLGNYDEFGAYQIDKDIKVELLNCRKVIEDSYENILFVRSQKVVNAFSHLSFAVRITNSQNIGYKTATLELLEPIYKAKGYIENTQATPIKQIDVKNDEHLKNTVFEAFNIFMKDDPTNAKRELKEDEEFNQILTRKIKLLYIKNKTKKVREQADMVCYENIGNRLQTTEKGKEVLKEYKKVEQTLKKYMGLDDNDYKTRKEALINVLESKGYDKADQNISNIINTNNAQNVKSIYQETHNQQGKERKNTQTLNVQKGKAVTPVKEIYQLSKAINGENDIRTF